MRTPLRRLALLTLACGLAGGLILMAFGLGTSRALPPLTLEGAIVLGFVVFFLLLPALLIVGLLDLCRAVLGFFRGKKRPEPGGDTQKGNK